MYKSGELRVETSEDNFDAETGYDSRADDNPRYPYAVLPHSCDAWHIGGIHQIDLLINDLQVVRARMARIIGAARSVER